MFINFTVNHYNLKLLLGSKSFFALFEEVLLVHPRYFFIGYTCTLLCIWHFCLYLHPSPPFSLYLFFFHFLCTSVLYSSLYNFDILFFLLRHFIDFRLFYFPNSIKMSALYINRCVMIRLLCLLKLLPLISSSNPLRFLWRTFRSGMRHKQFQQRKKSRKVWFSICVWEEVCAEKSNILTIQNQVIRNLRTEQVRRFSETSYPFTRTQGITARFKSFSLMTFAMGTFLLLWLTVYVSCIWCLITVKQCQLYRMKWASLQRSRHSFTCTQ